jgi:hypothetical protein
LVNLPIGLIAEINTKAECEVEQAMCAESKKVHGKTNKLYSIVAAAALQHPDDSVHQVAFPAVGEGTLHAGKPPSMAPLYRALADADRRGEREAAAPSDGVDLYDGEPVLTDGWAAGACAVGTCVLFVVPASGRHGLDVTGQLKEPLRAGRLGGGLVPIAVWER